MSSDKLFISQHRYCFILGVIKTKKANWIGHTLHRDCLIKHVTEGKIEGRIEISGRQRRRCEQLLDNFQETQITGR
jgi:hypothetical protein